MSGFRITSTTPATARAAAGETFTATSAITARATPATRRRRSGQGVATASTAEKKSGSTKAPARSESFPVTAPGNRRLSTASFTRTTPAAASGKGATSSGQGGDRIVRPSIAGEVNPRSPLGYAFGLRTRRRPRRRIEMRTPTPALAAALALALPAASARAEPEPIKIGALLSVTGPAAFLGAPEARTLEMLAADLNARGGIGGRKVVLLVKDTAGNPEKAISFARQLVDEEQVFAIIGPATSGESMAVKAIAGEGKTLLVSCAAAEAIVNPVSPWVFKTAQKDSHALAKLFQRMKKAGATRIGLLSSNTGFGKAGREAVAKLAPEHGLQLVADEVYDKAATDLTAEVTKVKAANPQAILNWSIEPAQAIVIKNARQIGLAVPIFQSHGFANIQYAKAAGAAAEGVVFPASRIVVAEALPDGHPQKAVLLAYKKAYEARYGEEASAFGGYAHDAFQLLVKVLGEAGTDREKVRAALEATKGFVGTAGLFSFSPADHNGLDVDAFEMVTVKDGRFVLLAR